MESLVAYWTYLYDKDGSLEKSDDFETYQEAVEGYEELREIGSPGMHIQIWGRNEGDESICVENEEIA